jgi:hypothetical protein
MHEAPVRSDPKTAIPIPEQPSGVGLQPGAWKCVRLGFPVNELFDSAAHGDQECSGQPPSRTRFDMIMSVKEHEMHHRGQLMLVERMLGIVPHLTRAMQARMAQMQAGASKAQTTRQ